MMKNKQQLTALANRQEVNRPRVVADERDTRGAPTNPLRPIITTPTPQPTTTGTKPGK